MTKTPDTIPAVLPNKNSKSAFFTLGDRDAIQSVSGRALQSYEGIHSSLGRDRYKNHDRNTSVRTEFTRSDYEFFRPQEAIPHDAYEIIAMCRGAYRRVGIIRNVMDLMSDFGCQGARLVHPNPTIQKFYRGWWKKVDGARICERFLNLLYREGVAVTKRTTGKLKKTEQKRFRTMGDKLKPDIVDEPPIQTTKSNIPLKYNFLNPLCLKVLGEELSPFVGQLGYALKVSYILRSVISNPKNEVERRLIEQIPQHIREAIVRGDSEIPLDPDKVRPFFYKKDDWTSWADPMTYAIMDDIMLLEKMKLADLAALDGAISQVRLWKLGHLNESNPESSIFPTDVAIDRLSDILMSNPGGGAFDIIWGPELTVEEYKTNVHQFLGEEKYKPVWNSIYAGLGVPPTLTGAATSSGFTNNYISLKTLIQRLEYGRSALRAFWEQEIELVRQAMGFKQGARLVFDNMVLSDEAAEKALLIQLVDRDVLSIETLIERFGELPEFEQLRLQREERDREKNKMKPKASPWHTPEKVYEFMKTALQRGYIGPEQTGITEHFPEEFLDIETPFDKQLNKRGSSPGGGPFDGGDTNKGEPGKGRPINSKDKGPIRDTRTPKPAGSNTAAYLTALMWAKDAQNSIAEILTPIFLQHHNKKSVRQLSAKQTKEMEEVKFAVLCNSTPYSHITHNHVRSILEGGMASPANYRKVYQSLHSKVLAKRGEELTVGDMRTLQAGAYAMLNCDEKFIYESESE